MIPTTAQVLSRKPFTVTAEFLARPWGGRRQAVLCDMCSTAPQVGSTMVFVLGDHGAPNIFACWDCVGMLTTREARAAWSRKWCDEIAPILLRWKGWYS